MAAVELANAYITIVPSATGIKSAVEKELADLDGVGKAAGEKAGSGFGAAFKGKAKDLAAGAGLAASAALGAGYAKSLDISAGNDKLAAQLGLTGAEAKTAGNTAAKVYSGAWGDSLGEVNGAVAQVMSTLGTFGVTGDKAVQGATKKALDFAKAFDTDIAVAVGNAGILLDSGLAKNADHAFDLMVAGMQKVPVAFQDEFGEATKEYSQFFAGLGFSGEEAMGVLAGASKGGAYMVDKVGDSIKEFTIKTRDGNKETAAALSGMFGEGKAKALLVDLAAGGPAAAQAFGTIAAGITNIQDPLKKSQAAVALFGTPFEDISGDAAKVDDVLANLASGSLPNVAGAADAMSATLNTNTASTIESLKRRFELATASIAGIVGPVGVAAPALGGLVTTFNGLGGVTSKIGPALKGIGGAAEGMASGLGSGVRAAGSFAKAQALATAGTVRATAVFLAHKVATLAGAVATGVATAATAAFNFVMALNPIVLVVIAIVALIAALVLAYHKVDWFKAFVDAAFRLIGDVVGWVVEFIKKHWQTLLAILTGPIGIAVLIITKNWDTIKAGFNAVKDFIGDKIKAVAGFFTDLSDRVHAIIGGVWDWLKSAFTGVVEFYRGGINLVVGFFTNMKDNIVRVAKGLFDPILDAWKGIINAIIGAWNRIDFGINVSIPDWVPGIGGQGFKVDDLFPDIPTLAHGGIVPATPGGRIIRVAEAGRAEAVIPLGGRGLGGGDTYNVTTPHASPIAAARAIADEQAWRRRTARR